MLNHDHEMNLLYTHFLQYHRLGYNWERWGVGRGEILCGRKRADTVIYGFLVSDLRLVFLLFSGAGCTNFERD